MHTKKKNFIKVLRSTDWKITLLTYFVAILFVFPVFWVFLMSLKNSVDSFAIPPKLIFKPVLENFIKVFQNNFFVENYKNSFLLAISSTVLSLLIGIPAAYAITRFRFRGRELLSFWILVTRMAPASALVVAFFMILNRLRLIDTFVGLNLVYMSFNIGYIIWMVRGFILSVPIECEEAATVDGCTPYGIFWNITLPMCIPGIVSVGIQAFIFAWNEFLYALILTRTNWKTAPIAVLSYITSEGIMWGELAAASILIVLPVLVLAICIQKYIVSGLTMGAVKS
ncbi:MAG TPA: carbohydrate ABC transporter permease [Bacillota bacterium]